MDKRYSNTDKVNALVYPYWMADKRLWLFAAGTQRPAMTIASGFGTAHQAASAALEYGFQKVTIDGSPEGEQELNAALICAGVASLERGEWAAERAVLESQFADECETSRKLEELNELMQTQNERLSEALESMKAAGEKLVAAYLDQMVFIQSARQDDGFTALRAALVKANSIGATISASSDMTAEAPEDSGYCQCGAVHTGLENAGRCEACGKAI
jgi:hypothetical protein